MEDNSKLQLDTGSINNRNGVCSSLTDINDINIFTTDFENQILQINNQRQEKEKIQKKKTFSSTSWTKEDDIILPHLFVNTEIKEIVRNEPKTITSLELTNQLSGFAILFVIFVSVLFAIFYKKGTSKNVHND